ncbi:hypothetical protein EUX98_g1161, partial [Antrodiella citrinella]
MASQKTPVEELIGSKDVIGSDLQQTSTSSPARSRTVAAAHALADTLLLAAVGSLHICIWSTTHLIAGYALLHPLLRLAFPSAAAAPQPY